MNNFKTYTKVIKITDDCINCSACEIECPVKAVNPGQSAAKLLYINNDSHCNDFISQAHYYIDPFKCTACAGSYSTPRCNEVCPVACCVPAEDDNFIKDSQELNVLSNLNKPSNLNKFSLNKQFLKLNPFLFTNISLN